LLKYILFVLLSFNLYALEVSLQGAKEDFAKYSILHIKNKNSFLCQAIKNDFDITTKVVCAFSKRPSKKFRTIQNDFFKIVAQVKDKTFFLIITPYQKIKLFPMIFDLTKDDTVFTADVKLSNHWMMVGFADKIPFIQTEKVTDTSINFPYFHNGDKLPYIGSLDLKGNPVHIKKIQDVADYLKIKRYFKDEKYERCIDLIDEIIEQYPNSLFISELLFYKIKVFSKLKEYDQLIDVSKVYFREYSSNENIPEVLALTANAYAKMGINSDADYFFDRLFSEHYDSPFTQWGYVYKANMLDASGASSKALYYFNKALQETQDIEIAATAAYALVNYYIKNAKTDEAIKYTMKIINAKPDFFMNNYKQSIKIMNFFKEEQEYEVASAIVDVIINEINDRDEDYEKLLKDKGIWLSKTDKKQEALNALNLYIDKFENGEFITEVKIAKDSLFFDTIDENVTTQLKKYNELIERYKGDSIGNKALYEKAKLLVKNKMYKDVLMIEDSLLELDGELYENTHKIITDSAVGVMKNALQAKECQKVLDISRDYNITLSDEWDDGVYECSMKGANFLLAKQIANKHLQSKDLEKRKKWLHRYIKVDFRTGNYSNVVDASLDLIALIEDDTDSEYKDIYRILFDAYDRLEEPNNMIDAIVKIQEVFGSNYKDIERYVAVMSIGNDMKDDNLIIKYGSEVLNIQNNSNSYAQSPYVEFTVYQAYVNKENYNEALEIIKALDSIDLNNSQRARQKYILGTIYEKLWREDEAKEAYQDAIDADATSPWAQLAKGAMDI